MESIVNNDEVVRNLVVTDDEYKFIKKVVEIVFKQGVQEGSCRSEPVVRFRTPEHLNEIWNFSIGEKPSTMDELIDIVEQSIIFCSKTAHPLFLNQFSAGLDPYGIIGIWISDVFNANVFTYEGSPLFTLMENFVIREIANLFGYPKESEGVFSPGGSVANAYAMNIARYNRFPEIKESGMYVIRNLVVFVSEDSHYSNRKMAGLLGIGQQNVINVRTNQKGQMDINDLRRLVMEYSEKEKQFIPFMVVATAGTTVLGAFDPLEEIHLVCKQYNMWLHVDAAWGGVAIFSEKYRANLAGIEKSDSFSWSPQKALQIPQQCSVMMVRYNGLLTKAHTCDASYLFTDSKSYNSIYDLGDKYLQCGRKPDVFKLWFVWKAKGYEGFRRHIDNLLKHSEYLTAKIKDSDCFKLVHEPAFVNVCFWYIPKTMQKEDDGPITEENFEQISQLTKSLKEKMLRRGSIMISDQSLHNIPNFFRFICCSSNITTQDCDYLLSEIEQLAATYNHN